LILVTGDLVLDHNIYEGGRLTPDAPPGNGSRYLRMPGGALLTHGLLHGLDSAGVQFGLEQTTAAKLQSWPEQFHTRSLWRTVDNIKPEPGRHWAMERHLGYGEPGAKAYPGKSAAGVVETPEILVVDDGNLGFRESPACWPVCLAKEQRPPELQWVILKMSHPLACGSLWTSLMRGSWRERLIVVVSADQLRREGLRVAGGLSWETSVDDIVEELASNRALRGLRQCRHLIVVMRSDAALWLDQPGGDSPAHCQLVFDRKLCEGEWEEKNKDCNAYGFLSTVTASVAWSLAQQVRESASDRIDLTVALAAGLSGTRFLRKHGHGPARGVPAFPFGETAQHLKTEAAKHGKGPEFAYAGAEVGGEGEPASSPWTILSHVSPWHAAKNKISYEPARRVALLGPDHLPGVPCATFGLLQTLDRHEIDSLRTIRQLMLMYRGDGNTPRKQPLCLGVFGAPGSGKSFGLKQIAAGVFGDKAPVLEFNLSQFSDPADLIGAFHQVRDKVLSGPTPVVFWDEFDSEELKWLQYFLAPMQDGAFQEGQITHFLGKSVFVFAGATSYTFAQFVKPLDITDFRFRKGPDFVSRLAGYLDIAGPNPREATAGSLPDREFPVRRAMVIRTAAGVFGDKPLQIERGLLTALLGVDRYCNGARSLDRLVSYIRDRGGMPLRRAYLPPDEILALCVEDVAQFHRITRTYSEFYSEADLLARVIHQDWLKRLSPEHRLTNPNAKPWDDLTPDVKDSNLAAALRIPAILELVGLTLEEGAGTSPAVSKILHDNLELMAEAEHGGWEEQKRIDGWTYAANRVDAAFRHNLLVPYDRLTEEIKGYDRNTIGNYPKYAAAAGFGIVPAPQPKTER